jgi:O-antigen ligase
MLNHLSRRRRVQRLAAASIVFAALAFASLVAACALSGSMTGLAVLAIVANIAAPLLERLVGAAAIVNDRSDRGR